MAVFNFFCSVVMLALNIANCIWLVKASMEFKGITNEKHIVFLLKFIAMCLFNTWVVVENGLVANGNYLFGSILFSNSIVNSVSPLISLVCNIEVCSFTIWTTKYKLRLAKQIGEDF